MSKCIDMTGWKMWEHGVPDSMLSVIKRVENSKRGEAQWLCECSCDEHNQIISTSSLIRNQNNKGVKSCGCLHKKISSEKFLVDMTGWVMKEHGVPDSRLTVVKRVQDYIDANGVHIVQYLCKCDCGNQDQIVVRGSNLRNGHTKSCGCLPMEKLIERSKKENKKDLSGNFGIIWSTNTNEEIYFDLEDAEIILKYTWYINKHGYPETHVNKLATTMHKLLGYYYPDHSNKNKLDNRKENLRLCTVQENNRNMPLKTNNKSGFTGVYFNCKNNKWVAFIRLSDKQKYLGSFANKFDAIKTRLNAENKYFGEFAPQRHLFAEYGINNKEEII